MIKDKIGTVAALLHSDGVGQPAFLGSAFAFRRKTCFLTAAHCLGAAPPSDLFVASARLKDGRLARVQEITRHPRADIAVLRIGEEGTHRVDPIFIVAKNYGYGDEVAAVGFSEDSTREGTVKPVARLFRGFLQRFFEHTSHMGYAYPAAEVSFPCPAGLSGGPVVSMPQGIHLVGLMAENFESTTYLHSVEEVQEASSRYKETVHRVIQYGLLVMVDDEIEAWLTRVVGPEF